MKTAYLQLRQAGLEDELYNGIDLNNVSYSELLERATKILEDKAKTEEIQLDISDESGIVIEESVTQQFQETIKGVQEVVDSGARINELGEIIRENNSGKGVIPDSDIDNEITQSTSTGKKLEQPQQIKETQSTNIWKSRFQNWYGAIDRVSQSVKNKFVKMKSDIVKAISEKLKEKTNFRQVNTQEQDTNER